MLWSIALLVVVGLAGAALFFFLRSNELSAQLRELASAWRLKEEAYTSECNKLEKIRHIPDIIERARKSKEQAEARLAAAEIAAEEITQRALTEAHNESRKFRDEAERQLTEAKSQCQRLLSEADTVKEEARAALAAAKVEAQRVLDQAQKEAREVASKARKDAKEKRDKADEALNSVTVYALEIRQKAEQRANEIAGEAYEAKGKLKEYQATAEALKNRIEKYYKIGLTRRLDPKERIRELGDASVPFSFDVHAVLASEDAPALETALHKRFLEQQVNKVNKRKEFFRVTVEELRKTAQELGIDAAWTLEAEAAQYRETLALEQAMKTNTGLKQKWLEEQATLDFADEDQEAQEQELEPVET